jgi:hypothetical protein
MLRKFSVLIVLLIAATATSLVEVLLYMSANLETQAQPQQPQRSPQQPLAPNAGQVLKQQPPIAAQQPRKPLILQSP